MTKKIFRSILIVSMIVFLISMTCILWVVYRSFFNQLETELEKEAQYLAIAVEHTGKEALGDLSGKDERVTLVAQDGTVLYDNYADENGMENHADREEIEEAMAKGSGQAIRQSSTMSQKTVYYALRLEDGSVLRVSSTQDSVMSIVSDLIRPLIAIAAVMVVLSAVFASKISRKIVEPLNQLDLENPDQNDAYDEVAPLLIKISRQQNTIRAQLEAAKSQQEEFTMITEHMEEGLFVLDSHGNLLSFNRSGLEMLGVSEAKVG